MIITKDSIDKIVLVGGRTKTTYSQMFQLLSEKPDYLINAGMFDMNSGLTVCDTIVDGTLINGGNYTDKGFIFENNQVIATTTVQAKSSNANYFLGGSPTLVWNNEVNIDSKGFTTWFTTLGKAIRIGLGITNNGDIVVEFPNDKMTLKKFAERMKELGCTHAINLDGGGSTRVMQNTNGSLKAINNPTENRPVSTWIAIYLTKSKKTEEGNDNTMKTVCIDPGHAKNTSGKRSFDGKLLEYEFNRDVAKRLKAHLERHNVNCIYSCDIDSPTDVHVSKRAKLANDKNAYLYISIHGNAYGTSWNSASGWEIYVYKKGGNAEKVAKKIQASSIPYLGLKDRGIKEANYAVLKETSMPAVLIEHGFYTNKEECAKLLDSNFREKCAIADAKGILEYMGIKWIEPKQESKNLVKITEDTKVVDNIVTEVKANEVYTIVEEKDGWGKLKSGVGWINLEDTKKI